MFSTLGEESVGYCLHCIRWMMRVDEDWSPTSQSACCTQTLVAQGCYGLLIILVSIRLIRQWRAHAHKSSHPPPGRRRRSKPKREVPYYLPSSKEDIEAVSLSIIERAAGQTFGSKAITYTAFCLTLASAIDPVVTATVYYASDIAVGTILAVDLVLRCLAWGLTFLSIFIRDLDREPEVWWLRLAWALTGLVLLIQLLTTWSNIQQTTFAPKFLSVVVHQFFGVSFGVLALFNFSGSNDERSRARGRGSLALLAVLQGEQVDHPMTKAGLLSRFSFSYMNSLFATGRVRQLHQADIPPLLPSDTIDETERLVREALAKEKKSAKPSILRMFHRLYGRELYLAVFWLIVNKALGLLGPVMLKWLLHALDEPANTHPKWYGFLIAVLLSIRSLATLASGNLFDVWFFRIGMRMNSGITASLFAKLMTISAQARAKYSVGQLTNLMSVDVGRLNGIPMQLFDILTTPIELAVAFVLIYKEVSWGFMAGVGVIAVVLPLNAWVTSQIQRVTKAMLEIRDERVKLCSEMLHGIRVLKMYAWEETLAESVSKLRQKEVEQLRRRKYLDCICVYLWATMPVFVSLATFSVVVWSGEKLTAAKAFTSLALLGMLIHPANNLPWVINGFLEALVSAKRLQAYLLEAEDAPTDDFDESSAWLRQRAKERKEEKDVEGGKRIVIDIQSESFRWEKQGLGGEDETNPRETEQLLTDEEESKSDYVLREISLKVKASDLCVICGPVASGKSSLLAAIMGEMTSSSGPTPTYIKGRAAYVSQIAWIQNGSVKDNILFGSPMIESWYQQVVRACCLDVDFKALPAGDGTELGEKGVNLSGGQKLRITLARAVYQDADVYLFDDPLSAVDAEVGRHIFKEVLGPSGILAKRGRTRILITNAVHLLPLLSDKDIIYYLEGGKFVESGSFHFLVEQSGGTHLRVMYESSLKSRTKHEKEEEDGVAVGHQPIGSEDGVHKDPKPEAEKGITTAGLTEEEQRKEGIVAFAVVRRYFQGVGLVTCLVVLISLIVMQATRNASDWWISYWASHEGEGKYFLTILAWIAFVNTIATIIRSVSFAFGGLKAAVTLHEGLLHRIIKAPVAFFDRTPVGRILNRFSSDQYSVDESLPFMLNIFLAQAIGLFGAIIIICAGSPLVIVALIPLGFLYYTIQSYYRQTSRELRRLDATARSPIYSYFSETIDGVLFIKGLSLQYRCQTELNRRLQLDQQNSFNGMLCGKWLAVRLDFLGIALSSFVAFFAVMEYVFTGTVNAGVVGLTLTYALPLVGNINGVIWSFTETERQMIAVERLKEFSEVEPEADVVPFEENTGSPLELEVNKSGNRLESWPSWGAIDITSLEVRYPTAREAAVRKLTCSITAGEKVGICGRTGAGKSSLMLALFRMVSWEGYISIDGVDIRTVPLPTLRAKLGCIPQDPLLFSGSVRFNLDPEGAHSDADLWFALERCHLKKAIEALPGGLSGSIREKGENLSVGQRQLLCLGRALLRRARVLCIDEATASIDVETDRLVQQTIREEFHSATVLTVAHRISTIMDCERVLVLDHGTLAEFDSPQVLLNKPYSKFAKMCKEDLHQREE